MQVVTYWAMVICTTCVWTSLAIFICCLACHNYLKINKNLHMTFLLWCVLGFLKRSQWFRWYCYSSLSSSKVPGIYSYFSSIHFFIKSSWPNAWKCKRHEICLLPSKSLQTLVHLSREFWQWLLDKCSPRKFNCNTMIKCKRMMATSSDRAIVLWFHVFLAPKPFREKPHFAVTFVHGEFNNS